MKGDNKQFLEIFLRYILLFFIAFLGLDLFYYVFFPLTTYPIYHFLNLFYYVILQSPFLMFGEKTIEIIGACVGGAAYFLLLILNLATPKIKNILRVKIFVVSFLLFYIVNLVRIIVLSIMFLEDSLFLDFTHKFLWYFGSTILVVLIWYFIIKIFKVKGIPIWDDLKFLFNKTIFSNKKSSSVKRKKRPKSRRK